MKRPAGVVVSAVLLALFALFQIVLALIVFLGANEMPRVAARPGMAAPPPVPGWMPMYMSGIGVLILAVAGWGIVTAFGLHRLRQWARFSILIYGGAMAFVGFFSLLVMIVLLSVGLMGASAAHSPYPANTKAILEAVMAVILLFYAAMTAIGVWWLVYFNRKTVRAAFAGADAVRESRRPFLVAIFAGFMIVGAPACLAMALIPLPAALFGLAVHGWPKFAFYTLCGGANLAAGVGLWRMKEWARRLALGILGFGAANSVVFMLRPNRLLGYSAEVNRAMAVPPSPLSEHMQMVLYAATCSLSVLLLMVIAAMLHHYRSRFASPEQAQPV